MSNFYDIEYNGEIDYDGEFYDSAEEEISKTDDIFIPCMKSIVMQIKNYVFAILFWNILFRVTTQTIRVPRSFQHSISIVYGLALSYCVFDWKFLHSIVFIAVEYALYLLMTRSRRKKPLGDFMLGFCLAILVLGELVGEEIAWHNLRGSHMIAACKMISIAYDIDRNQIKRMPRFLEFWGYILCPGNVILGPWHSFSDYLKTFQRTEDRPKWKGGLVPPILNGTLSIFFLYASVCAVPWHIPNYYERWWIEAFKSALSHRCTHYFVCFLSQCTMVIAGCNNWGKDNSYLGQYITYPLVIEMPRSLYDVCLNWNISLSRWLSTYIFDRRQPSELPAAVISTYLASIVLLGVNLQVAAVLLTLGLAVYAEVEFRKIIAEVYNACVLIHPCGECSHKYNNKNIWVWIGNIMFSMVAAFQLAYLGVLYSEQLTGEHNPIKSIAHIRAKWGDLNYLGHVLLFGSYTSVYSIKLIV